VDWLNSLRIHPTPGVGFLLHFYNIEMIHVRSLVPTIHDGDSEKQTDLECLLMTIYENIGLVI